MKLDSNCDQEFIKEELKARLSKLIEDLEKAQKEVSCYENKVYPECPPDDIPPPRKEPHPYIPGKSLWNYPSKISNTLKVTLDGRLAQPYNPERYFFEELPLRAPPWSRPRYPSIELRGGVLYEGCDCWKKNGLQDDCRRWDCAGRPECTNLSCGPSIYPPTVGVRHRNGFENTTAPSSKTHTELGSYQMKSTGSIIKNIPPLPPLKSILPDDIVPCRK